MVLYKPANLLPVTEQLISIHDEIKELCTEDFIDHVKVLLNVNGFYNEKPNNCPKSITYYDHGNTIIIDQESIRIA